MPAYIVHAWDSEAREDATFERPVAVVLAESPEAAEALLNGKGNFLDFSVPDEIRKQLGLRPEEKTLRLEETTLIQKPASMVTMH